jgi:hypothetical protein
VKRPSNAWYGLAGAFLVAGIAVFIWLIASGVTGMQTGFQRGVVPGKIELQVGEPGTYVIYHEYQSVIDGKIFRNASGHPPLAVEVISRESGATVDLQAATMNSTYTINSRSGRSMLSFEADQPGAYTLTAAYPAGSAGPEVVLAVGRGIGFGRAARIIGAIASLFTGGALAVLTGIITFVRQRQATR